MKKAFLISIALCLCVASPAQARDFSDLRTELATAPYRVVSAVGDFHPLASLSASMRNGMAAWDEFSLRVEDVLVIGWGRLVLGAEEIRFSADRGLVIFFDRLRAAPVPSAAIPAAIGTAVTPPPAPDPAAARWVDEVERLFRSSP